MRAGWSPEDTGPHLRVGLERRDGKLHYYGHVIPDGPWHDEPDRVDFEHDGHPCLLLRGPLGAWCGYVGVPPNHPWHGADSMSDVLDVEVHGGITYASPCHGAICHVPKPGETDHVYWLGFDCAHYRDLVPAMLTMPQITRDPRTATVCASVDQGTYRDVAYVRAQTEALALQVTRAKGGGK